MKLSVTQQQAIEAGIDRSRRWQSTKDMTAWIAALQGVTLDKLANGADGIAALMI